MRNRVLRWVSVLVVGTCMQMVSCGNKQFGEILAGGITDTASALSAFAIEAAVNNTFGFNN